MDKCDMMWSLLIDFVIIYIIYLYIVKIIISRVIVILIVLLFLFWSLVIKLFSKFVKFIVYFFLMCVKEVDDIEIFG